jgi:small subunit ribosomal protein S1
MNTEIEKNVVTDRENNVKAIGQHRKKKKKPNPRSEAPTVHYSQEELLAVETEPFWNRVHSAEIKSRNDDGLVLSIKRGEKVIDAFVPNDELCAHESHEVGQELRIYLDDALSEKGGSERPIVGSEIMARDLDLLERAFLAKEKNETVPGYVVSPIKGGYSVALFAENREDAEKGFGFRAFLPFGRTSLRREEGLADGDDQRIVVRIAELDPARGNIVVSRRESLVQERKKGEEEFFTSHHEGDEVIGKVTALMPYGAFVNLGAVDGFLHMSDISWDKRPRVKDLVPVGKEIRAKIIEINKDTKKIKLSMKNLNTDPWQTIEKNYKPGSEVEGNIVAFADFGAFVRFPDGVEGLIHVGEITWNRIRHPSQFFQIGDHVKAAVLRVDKEARRISLSTKALELSPVERLSGQFPIGAVLKTKVASLHDFGMFVELDEQSKGFVPRSEVSWVRSEEPLEKLYSVGQELEAAVLGYDSKRQRVSLSVKRVHEDPWNSWRQKYRKGSSHKAKVLSVSRNGIECQLEAGLVAFCPRSQLAEGEHESARINAKTGDEIEVLVTQCDTLRQRISVSQKALQEHETKRAYESYLNEQGRGSARTTLGDAFNKKLDRNKGNR